MHDVVIRRLKRGPRKRHSEPATGPAAVIASAELTLPISLLLLAAKSNPEITTSEHLYVDFCSEPPYGGRGRRHASMHTLRTPPRSPCCSTPSSPGRSPRHRQRLPKDRRRSLGVPGARSPNGRRLWREMEQNDPWLDFRRQRSPAVNHCVTELFGKGQQDGYRCRSFSITSKGTVINLGEVILADETRRTSTASCPNGPDDKRAYRVRLIGACGVGKSCLIQQFVEGSHLNKNIVTSPPTSNENSLESLNTRLILDGEECELDFEETTDSYVDKQQLAVVDAFVVVFSIADAESMDFAEDVISRLRALCGSKRQRRKSSGSPANVERTITKAIILVGNKLDLVRCRVIETEEGKKTAQQYECKFIETSACLGHNVDELLVGILKQIRLRERSGSVPAWCHMAIPVINLPQGQQPDPEVYDPTPSPAVAPVMAHRPSIARTFCGKARGFISQMWTKCDAVKSRSCDNLNVL